jgi:hypothetical protein
MDLREQDKYALVLQAQRGPGGEAPFRTCKLVDGERALALYSYADAAEAHLMLENLGPE